MSRPESRSTRADALSASLASRTASGPRASTRAGQRARGAVSSSRGGHDRRHQAPLERAASRRWCRRSGSSCFARPRPTTRGSRCVAPAAGMMPEAHFGLAELRVVRRDAQVARERQLAAAAERVAVDRRDRRLREPFDRREQRRVDRREPVVAARARESGGCRRRRRRPDSPAPVMISAPTSSRATEVGERGGDLAHRLPVERVADVGTIDRQRRDAIGTRLVDMQQRSSPAVSTRTRPCRPSARAAPPSRTARAADTAGTSRPCSGAGTRGC